jgi:hypothetical protein
MVKELQSDEKVAFDEFKLYYESTEKVTDRRLEANRWNYSICTAILVAVGAIINWSLAKQEYFAISAVAVVVLSGMAVLYCTLWTGQIRDLKELNNAKFDILNAMAPSVCFGESAQDKRVSYCPFEREWNELKEAKIAQQVRSIKIIALKSSRIEYVIPQAFRILFLLIMAVVAVGAVLKFQAP